MRGLSVLVTEYQYEGFLTKCIFSSDILGWFGSILFEEGRDIVNYRYLTIAIVFCSSQASLCNMPDVDN